jgi:predicted nucleic acid-binding protein
VIAYFDTSSVVPLVIDEAGGELCNRVWNESARIVSVRLLYPEARAALARAQRMGRLTRPQLTAAVTELDSIFAEIDLIELTAGLALAAGELAEERGLRGYDAVHLAAARSVADDELVFVTGDEELAAAATALGLTVTVTATS